ncbi:MAG: hypothetical protein KC621_26700 [Myxococcales bacterium]|nr:hypothetical protein [Myxococcales bacterium]
MRHLSLLTLSLTGCLGPWPGPSDTPTDTTDTSDTDTTGPTGDTGTTETTHTGTVQDVVLVTDSITRDTLWTADKVYELANRATIYVEGNSVLTIEPGTTILGNAESSIIVSRDARIEARGRADAPIVFTSVKEPGSRRPGDWGGLVLLGNASVNKSLPRQIEGVVGDEPRAQYGGSDDTSNCGALDYVRVEFAGFEVFDGNELNGLTLGGCGSSTFLRHIQVHRGLDDGIEIFGGMVDLKYVVITGAGDDSLDWDEGWRGRVQFLLAQQYPTHPDPTVTKNGDEGIEADGYVTDELPAGTPDGVYDTNHTPFSTPTLYNLTLLGSGDPTAAQSAMDLKEGTGGALRNLLVGWQPIRGVDVEHPPTVDMITSSQLKITNSVFFDIGPTGDVWTDPDTTDDDGGFDEQAWLDFPAYANRLGDEVLVAPTEVPTAAAPGWLLDPPAQWIPDAGSAAASGAATPPADEFFDVSATYVGAIRPGTTQAAAWWAGWTAYPVD